MSSSKKLINQPDEAVDESLSGLVASRHNLSLIEGRRVVVVNPLADVKGRVAVICGGGSGTMKYFSKLKLAPLCLTKLTCRS